MKEIIKNEIVKYVLESKENWSTLTNDRYYDEPIIKFVSADDPLFAEYKEIIYPEHLTPKEAFELTFGKDTFSGGSVISIVLPINEKIRISNRSQSKEPSKEFVLFNNFLYSFFNSISKHIETYLNEQGYRTVAPSSAEWHVIKPSGSNWSERHVAYAAGLGTFSLNEGFISEKGIAIRLTSVVTELKLAPDSRSDRHHNANCLFYSNGTCGACIKRCPVGALSKEGHDKMKCWNFAYGEEMKKLSASYGGNPEIAAGCSLCQTNVPCEFRNPTLAANRQEK